MRIPEQFDEARDITVRSYAPPPSRDSGSLRPQVFDSDDWPAPTRMSRLGPGPFLALGIVVGMAAALPITAWAVRTHRWPSTSSVEPTTAAPAAPRPAPLAAPVPAPGSAPALETARATPDPEFQALSDSASAPNSHAASEKIRRKPAHGKHAADRASRTHGVALVDVRKGNNGEGRSASGESVDDRAAAELTGAATTTAAAPRQARSAPMTRVEDQAAAELSTSLK